jgi:heptaprenyl diphosphate synthase
MKMRLPVTQEDRRIAQLAALAIGLSMAEAAMPSPLPGVKPGLANIIVLLVLAQYGWKAAAWVSMLRVVAGSLLLGTFLSPSFALSFSGAALSLAALALAQHLPRRLFGPVSQSILAAFAHVAGQLAVVQVWLIPHAGIAYLLPVFAAAALLFGTVNGIIAASLLARAGRVGQAAAPA